MNTQNNLTHIKETSVFVFNALVVILSLVFLAMLLFFFKAHQFVWIGFGAVSVFMSHGFFILNPNESLVSIFFGNYSGSAKESGFYWMNPLNKKIKISTKINNHPTPIIKVNDKSGNPIDVAAIITWRVVDTARAVFGVEDYGNFLALQSEAALRKIVSQYSYDDDEKAVCLRGNVEEIANLLKESVQNSVSASGIQIIDARFANLSYSAEIASVMLKKQQAQAIILARKKIVESAVDMVEKVLEELDEKEIVKLDNGQKATLITNLMTVLVSDKDATPTISLQK